MSAADHDAWISATLVHAIAEVTRALARTTPAPRGMPFFGLDLEVYEPQLLDDFCRQGIFRKYERVLIVDCGLGGAARWWATRWGCTVIGTAVRVPLARGADVLSRRAGLYGPTTFAAASRGTVPLRPESVTHVWLRDVSADADICTELLQTHTVLRPGGHLMVDTAAPDVVTELRRQAPMLGFIAIEAQTIVPAAAPHALLTGLSHLDSFVTRLGDDALGRALRTQVSAQQRKAQAPQPRAQFFAQRPS